MGVHASQTARSTLDLERRATFVGGKIDLPEIAVARELARALRAEEENGSQLSAGELYALGRLEEVFQLVISRYLRERDPGALERLLLRGQQALGVEESERLLGLFSHDFSLPGSRDVLQREFLVWSAIDENPAARPATDRLFAGLFKADPAHAALRRVLEHSEGDGTSGDDLLAVLRAPARASPDSLAGQLRYVLEHWGDLLGVDWTAILRGLDLLAEEAKRAAFGQGPGPAELPALGDLDDEPENYSQDQDWMPGVVLLAKNAYVWLDQLSRRFRRSIRRLDEIPDEVLDEIAGRGFTALWLIGLWERSAASERLKRLCGNPEAVASAYSLRAYRVAEDLGGDPALANLQHRAFERGVRLASDMVPNHLGLDSDWLLGHPERFLSLPESPFAAYSFHGPDLSPDPAVGVWVEDHYYDRTDAAVVFKRQDRRTGEVRYVYHGNDGTSTPWNDTAQLDYLNPETREAVIQTILEVARRFPLIRFDAAMTLARRHYQRLWFPAPGTGGAIPSRAEHGVSRERFAELMPREFWREVVDRVAREAPDTLLLAEAFWLMEGYFVRSLGMHRVYNSAFMNMIRDQENAKYRQLLKETLIFDPRILQRYVNFLTNPDERPAIDQFGDGDRYFGACVLLATLPGLPMVGHGQIEGYGEKYGMEYRRAYHEEGIDAALVARHEREIVPLLRRRRDFAGVERFELYDFVDASGATDENVLVYSNGGPDAPTLVVFHNVFSSTSGTVRRSVARQTLPERVFTEAFGLAAEPGRFWRFRDHISGLTFLRPAAQVAATGLAFELGAFDYHVFEGFQVLEDDARGRLSRLADRLGLNGVADLTEALADLDLEQATAALGDLLARPSLARGDRKTADEEGLRTLSAAVVEVLRLLDGEPPAQPSKVGERVETRLRALTELATLEGDPRFPASERMSRLLSSFAEWLNAGPETRIGLAALQILTELQETSRLEPEKVQRLAIEEKLRPVLDGLGAEPERVDRALRTVRLAWRRRWAVRPGLPDPAELRALFDRWVADREVQALIGYHQTQEGHWIWKEDFEDLVQWRLASALAAVLAVGASREERANGLVAWFEAMEHLRRTARQVGYRVDRPVGEEAASLPSEGASSALKTVRE